MHPASPITPGFADVSDSPATSDPRLTPDPMHVGRSRDRVARRPGIGVRRRSG
jgi:hypothetical protein